MENQHRMISGYRDLTKLEISRMNAVKQLGEECRDMIHKMRDMKGLDQRWVSIAETHLQQGFMAAVRSIARPESF